METHPQIGQVLGPTLTFNWCWQTLLSLFFRLRTHFGTSRSSSSTQQHQQQSIPMAIFSHSSHASEAPPIPPHQSISGNNDKKEIGIEAQQSSFEKCDKITMERGKGRRQNSISHSHLGIETALASDTDGLGQLRRNSATHDFSTLIGGILDLKEVADERRIYGTILTILDTKKVINIFMRHFQSKFTLFSDIASFE
jgi:hypothetical protein